MKILSCQLSAEGILTRTSMEAHQLRVSRLIRSACESNTLDLIFLPELSAIEYSEGAFENLAELSSSIDGWLCSSMAELALEIDTPICFGMPRRQGENHHISQIVLDRDGTLIGFYDKLHIAQLGESAEKPYFTPGNHISVFNIGDFRFGVIICYDMRFGEYVSMIARKHKIDVMLHPVAFSFDGTFASWRSFVCTRALENQIYWLSLNRAGKGWGHSVFCPPWFESESEVLELDEMETLQVIDLDRAKLQYAAENYPIGMDRLDDYSNLEVST